MKETLHRLGMARALEIIDDYHAAIHNHVPGVLGLCDIHSGDTCHLGAVLMEAADLIEAEIKEQLGE